MRILQVTPRPPFPPVDGGRVAMLAITRGLLNAGCDVDVFSLNPRRLPANENEVREALAPAMTILVPHDTDEPVSAVLSSMARRIAPPIARFASRRLEWIVVERLKRTRVDVVHLESVFLSWLIPSIRRHSEAAVVIRTQNIEYPILEQTAESEPDRKRRLLLRTMAPMLRRAEVSAWNSADAVVPISPEDASESRRLGCHVPMHVLPAGVEASSEAHRGDMDVAWFLGSLDYRPNQQAASWLAREVMPRLEVLDRGLRIEIGGSNPPESLCADLAACGMPVQRDVPDASAFAAARGVALAPVFSGGGMRIKILQAMANGNPVVATSVAASGMDVENGRHLLIADDPDAFAYAIVRLSRDSAFRSEITANARALVTSRYDNDALSRGLEAFYRRLVSGSRTRPRSARA